MANNKVAVSVNTTNVWDTSLINDIDVNSPEFKELLIRLYQNLNRLSLAVSYKTSGNFPLTEFITSQIFFASPSLSSTTAQAPSPRSVFRKVINFGSLPNAGLKSVPHGIDFTNSYKFIEVRAGSTNPVGLIGLQIPYASPTLANNIEIYVDAVNVNIITGSDRTAFTETLVVCEYIKT